MFTKFRDLKIKYKLLSGFGAILLLLIINSSFTIISELGIKKKAREVEIIDFTAVDYSTRLKETALKLEHFYGETIHATKEHHYDETISFNEEMALEEVEIQTEKFRILEFEFRDLIKDEPAMLAQLEILIADFEKYTDVGKSILKTGPETTSQEFKDKFETFHDLGRSLIFEIDDFQQEYVARLSQSLGQIDTMAQNTRSVNILLMFVTIILAMLLAFFLTRKIVRPISKLLEGTIRVSKGELDYRIEIHSEDEIGRLADSFDKMTKNLRETTVSRDYTDSIITSIIDCLVVIDSAAKIRMVNKVTCDLLGYKEEELTGKDISSLFIEEETLKDTELLKLIREGSMSDREMNFKATDGNKIPVLFSGAAMRDKQGNITGIVCVAKDITERKMAEEEREKLQEQILQSDKLASVGEIAAGIAHEINTPLNVILGYQELMLKKIGPGSPLEKYVSVSIEEVEICSSLIGEFLTYAHPTDSVKLKDVVDISNIIKKVIRMLITPIEKNINIKIDIDEGIPLMYGNNKQIMQVFVNLVNNAVQAMPSGGDLTISVKRVEVVKEQQDEGEVEFRVSDTGEGISEENIKKVFNPFFSTKRPGKGTGLGLAVCQRIMVNHGGAIRVESNPGEGTTFIGRLPVRRSGKPGSS